LWGWGSDKKDSLVKMQYLCKPKLVGGLGIKDIKLFNMVLLGKWKWR